MADNITLPTEQVVATKDVGSPGSPVHVQKTTPVDQTGTAIIPATEAKQTELAALIGEVQTNPTANTLLSRLKSILTALTDGTARMVLNAGTAIIGKVGIDQTTGGTTNGVVLKKANGDVVDPDAPAIIDSGVKLVPVTLSTDTNPYAAGDLLADAQIVAACVRANDSAGMLASIVLIDEADQGAAMTIYFASASASFGTENSAPGITDANARNILGFIDIATGDYKDLGGVKVAFKQNCNIPVSPATGTDDIYVAVVNGAGTPTFAADSLKLRLGFLI